MFELVFGIFFLLGGTLATSSSGSEHRYPEPEANRGWTWGQDPGHLEEVTRALAFADQLLANLGDPALVKIADLYEAHGSRLRACAGSPRGSSDLEANLKSDVRVNLEANVEDNLEASLRTELKADLKSNVGANLEANLEDNLEASLRTELKADLKSNVGGNLEANLEDNLEASLGTGLKADLTADLVAAQACFNIMDDLATLAERALNAGHDVVDLCYDLVGDLKEINDCQNESFLKKIPCYMKAFGDAQAIAARYADEMSKVLADTNDALMQLGADLHTCVSGDTAGLSERFEKNVALCKLKLI